MSLGPKRTRSPSTLEWFKDLHPRVQLRLALAGISAVLAVTLFTTCGGCGRRSPAGGDTTSAQAAGEGDAAPEDKSAFNTAALRDQRMWSHAEDGDQEDLTTLATHEGAIGLVEAADDPELRPTAIRAMAYARGWAQLPFLAKVASGKDDEEARLALDATVALAARPRTAEDPEDASELREGCEALSALARDAKRPRPRRVVAIRALRMMPCPPPKEGEDLPTDLDAK